MKRKYVKSGKYAKKGKGEPMPEPASTPPAQTPEEVVRQAEEDAKAKAAAESAAREKRRKQRTCLSCGRLMEDDECKECGVVIEGGKQVAIAKPAPAPSPEEPQEEPGFFDGLIDDGEDEDDRS